MNYYTPTTLPERDTRINYRESRPAAGSFFYKKKGEAAYGNLPRVFTLP